MRAPPEVTGLALLADPRRNQETAFTHEERERLSDACVSAPAAASWAWARRPISSRRSDHSGLRPQHDILETEVRAAIAVAERIFDASLARVGRRADLSGWIRGQRYSPAYRALPH
jgi:hypothetical protein